MPFCASAIVSPLLMGKTFSFEDFCSTRETKKNCSGRDRVNGEGGAGSHGVFWSKLLSTQRGVDGRTCKPPITTWANALKDSSKNSLKPNAASHNNASWCTDKDGVLGHSPSGGSLSYKGPTLQNIFLFFRVPPRISSLLVTISKTSSS